MRRTSVAAAIFATGLVAAAGFSAVPAAKSAAKDSAKAAPAFLRLASGRAIVRDNANGTPPHPSGGIGWPGHTLKDVAARTLSLDISQRALSERRAAWQPPPQKFERGYGALFSENITQANEGCDFGFLARPGRNPDPDPR